MKKIESPVDLEEVYKSMPELIPQKVNLNGSSKDDLMKNYLNVLRILRELKAAMGEASPHGRDYQTHHDPMAGTKARIAWSCRRILIHEMTDDIEYAALMVQGQ